MKYKELKLKNESGEEKTFNILFALKNSQLNKRYILYTDYIKDKDSKIKIFYAEYNSEGTNNNIKKVINQEEIKIIKQYIKDFQQDIKAGIILK